MTATRNVPSRGRVAFFLGDLGGGGAERVMVTLANGFVDRGFDTNVILARSRGPLVTELAKGVEVIDLGAKGVVRAVPRLVGYLRRRRPDALLATLDHANVTALAAKRLAMVRTPVYVRVASTLDVLEVGGTRMAALRQLVRWTYPGADAVIAVSEGVRDDLVRRGVVPERRVRVVYNPVIAEDFDARASEPVDHRFLRSPGPLIVAAGRLVPQKDYAILLEAFAALHTDPLPRLLLLGEGPLRSELLARADSLRVTERVDLPGYVPNPLPFMRSADLFVLSSRFEGLPSVLIQALACGTPVVSTDCPSGPSEVLDGGRFGPLVPVGDADALAEAMLATLKDPLPSSQLRARGRQFTVKDSLDAYEALVFGEDPSRARATAAP